MRALPALLALGVVHGLSTPPQRVTPMRADKPKWAGGGPASAAVNAVINTPWLWGMLKGGARKTLQDTAEKRGIPWRENTEALMANPEREALLERFTNPAVDYPAYYTLPFHAYDEGNLNWLAACECSSATLAMGNRVWPEEALSPEAAQARLRDSFTTRVVDYCAARGVEVGTAVDLGCSVGFSTLAVARATRPRRVLGVDLSPYFLAVASIRERQEWDGDLPRPEWLHAKAEDLPLADGTADLATLCYVCHELPQDATRNVFREIFRVLRPGGCVALTDNDPRSPVIQNLPPALFTLMKSTEPHSDEYYLAELEAMLGDAGFVDVQYSRSDPRHRTIIAQKPAA